MTARVLDTVGLKCPHPILKLAIKATDMNSGDTLVIVGDCPTFEHDVRKWCERLGKLVLSVKDEGQGRKRIQIHF